MSGLQVGQAAAMPGIGQGIPGVGIYQNPPGPAHPIPIRGLWSISACAEGGFVVLGGCVVPANGPHLFAGDAEACVAFVREKMNGFVAMSKPLRPGSPDA